MLIAGQTAQGARVGVLASPALQITGVQGKAAGPLGPELAYLDDGGLALRLIEHIKCRGRDSAARVEIDRIVGILTARGADLILVACSELSLNSRPLPSATACIDTIDALAEACVVFSVNTPKRSEAELAA